jgi:iron(III) transport system ATP-binding protein
VTLASDAFIHIDQLQVRHAGAPQPAVRGVSLKVRRGELLALLGPSGCGKSTLLRAVAGLQAVQAGHVWVAGQDLTHTPAHLRPVSLVFQSYALFPHLGVLDNVAYGLRAQGVSAPAAVQRARATLALVGLEDLATRNVAEVSGGQQQRVALARALVLEPQVLLLDEPLSNLHEALRRQVRSDIRQLQQRLGLTLLYVTHDQSEAMAVADRLALMHAGVVVQQGTPRQLYESPNNAFVAGFMGDARVFDLRRDTVGQHWLGPLRVPAPPGDLGGVAGAAANASVAVVRPHAWHIGPPSTRDLPARVQRSAYLGRVVEYLFATEVGDIWVVASGHTRRLEDGAPASLSLGPTGVVVLAA